MNSSFEVLLFWESTNLRNPDHSLKISKPLYHWELIDEIFEAAGWNKSEWELQLNLSLFDMPEFTAVGLNNDSNMLTLYKYSHLSPAIFITRHALNGGSNVGHDEVGGDESLSDNEGSDGVELWPGPDSDDEDIGTSMPEGSRGRHVYTDIGHANPNETNYFDDVPVMWNGNPRDITAGIYFHSKDDMQEAITLWSSDKGVAYRTRTSNKKIWDVYCATNHVSYPADLRQGPPCQWRARATLSVAGGGWKLTHWVDRHNCSGSNVGQQGRNVTAEMISHLIRGQIEVDLEYKVKSIVVNVREAFNVTVSYKKAWHGRRKALDYLFGDWETNIHNLPGYMHSLVQLNPGTKVVWKFKKGDKDESRRMLKYVFWAFGPCVRAFQHTFPVVMVDGTHLRGNYKGKLLIAVTKTANNHILPLAYALVDEESTHSWTWFLKHLRLNVLGDRRVCIISDRNAGLIAAWKTHYAQFFGCGWHRYCLRHIRSNLMDKFKGPGIKMACWRIGTALSEEQYNKAWMDMYSLSLNACGWLQQISEQKWTLYKDGGCRWGNTTTNVSESHNNTLKGTRFMPIKALVDSTLLKTASIFHEARGEIRNCNTFLSTYYHDKFMEVRAEAPGHIVICTDDENEVYSVRTRRRLGVVKFMIRYRDRSCTCGVWQVERFPCSHAIAVCLDRHENPNDLVDQFYTRSKLSEQFSGGFIPVLDNAGEVDLGWKLVPDYTRLAHHQGRGRRRMQRRRMSMDYQNSRSAGQIFCPRCHTSDHAAFKCPETHPRSDRVPIDRIYNAHGQYDTKGDNQ